MQNLKIFFYYLLVALVFFTGCLTTQEGNGFLKGTINIGPLCPVETNPPQPQCLPTEETYKAYPISVYEKESGKFVTTFFGGLSGKYEIKLPAGNYELKSETGLRQFIGKVTIESNKTTTFDISIDTGIR